MPWKTDSDGGLALVNGNPVWVGGDGKEVAADETIFKGLAEARREAAERRHRNAELEARIEEIEQTWEGLAPDEVRKAQAELERLKKQQRKAQDNGEGDPDLEARLVKLEEELEAERTRLKAVSTERESATKELEKLRAQSRRSALENWLGGSRYFAAVNGQDAPLSVLTPKLALPIVGRFLDVDEHGQVVGVWPKDHPNPDRAGKKIFNSNGEVARGDEITAAIFEEVEDLKSALRKQSATGAGSAAGGQHSSNTASRGKRWDLMSAEEKVNYKSEHGMDAAVQKMRDDAAKRQEAHS